MKNSGDPKTSLLGCTRALSSGYRALFAELLFRPWPHAHLQPPRNLLAAGFVCALIGLARTGSEVALGIRSFEADVVFAMVVWPVHLFLFGGAALHLFLEAFGARSIPASAILGVVFHAQVLHLAIAPLDVLGVALEIPRSLPLWTEPFPSRWLVPGLDLSLGIVVCWVLSAALVVRVLHTRLEIRGRHALPAIAAAMVALWVPAYIIRPSFNTLVEPLLGIARHDGTLLWGYGAYLALTACLGGLFYFRRVAPKDLCLPHRLLRLLQTRTASRVHVWILALSVLRSLIDDLWHPAYTTVAHWVLTFFNTYIYLYLLYLAVPWLSVRFLRLMGIHARVSTVSFLRRTVVLWTVYPAVSLINLLTDSPPLRSVGLFEYLPGFMHERTFLPAGMVVVIPILVLTYGRHLRRLAAVPLWKAAVAVTLALTVLYLLYYQYLLRLTGAVNIRFGLYAFAGAYTLTFLAPLLPLARDFEQRLGRTRFFIPCLIAATIASAALVIAAVAFNLDGPAKNTKEPGPAASLPAASTPGDGREPPRPIRWGLQLYVVPDPDSSSLLAHGYLLRVGDHPPRFRFELADGTVYDDPELLKLGSASLEYGNHFQIEQSDRLLLRYKWDRLRLAADPFLSTFLGNDDVHRCRVTLRGRVHPCLMLDERLSADLSGKHFWSSETFLFLVADDLTLLAFEYDGIADGTLMFGQVSHRVSQVRRTGETITVLVPGGTAHCRCRIFEPFRIYQVENGPRHSPLRCEVRLDITGEETTRVTAWGMMEHIDAPRRTATPR